MQLITNSRRSCFQRCHREHQLSYILGRRPVKTPEALGFGTLAHVGLEAWWTAWKLGIGQNALKDALAGISLKWQSVAEESELNDFDRVKAEEMLLGYDVRWAGDMADLEVLAVEVKFEVPLVNPRTGRASRTYGLGGKLDVLVRRRSTGEIFIIEHKTTASDIEPQSDYWLRLRIDGQVSTYYEGARGAGWDVFGCLYDVLRKPTQQPAKETPDESKKFTLGKPCAAHIEMERERQGRKVPIKEISFNDECEFCEQPRLYANMRARDETPQEYRIRIRESIGIDPNKHYGRGEVIRLDDDQAEHQRDAWCTANAMRMAENMDAHPRNPDACVRWSRFCTYFDVCTGVASIDDPARFRQAKTVHEELQDEAPENAG